MRFKEKNWLLLVILTLGLLLRVLNSTFGSPSLYISNDEAIAHLSAFNMIATKTPVSIANYTPLGAYVQIPFLILSFLAMKILGYVNSVSDFELFVLTHEGYFLFIPRLISALFGTLTILVIYKITLLLFKSRKKSNTKSIALIAASLTAVSFNLVHISHYGRPWAAALFFFILCAYFALRSKNLLSSASVGLSYAFHQVGVLAIPLILLSNARRVIFSNILALVLMVSMIAVFSSLTLKVDFKESIKKDQSFLKQGKFAADLLVGNPDLIGSAVRSFWKNLSVYFILNLLVTDGILFLFSVWGIIKNFTAKGDTRKIIFLITLYFMISSLFFIPVLRYLLPLILLLIPFAAYAIYSFFKNKIYLIFLVVILCSINSVWWNWLYIKKPTFILAYEWIIQNVPAQIPIAYIGGRYRTFAPNKQAILHVQSVNRGFDQRLLGLLPSNNYDNVRNILYVSSFPGSNKIENLENATRDYKVAFIVDYYIDPVESIFLQQPKKFELIKQFNPTRNGTIVGIPEPLFDASWNFPTNDKRKKVSMYSLSNTGPYVDILKIKY